MTKPTQTTKPNSETTYTAASLPSPSSQSLRKFDMTPIEKKVSVKKITRKTLASPIAAASLEEAPPCAPSASASAIRKVATKPRMNFGKRRQISIAFALSAPGRGLIWLVQM